MRLASAVPLSVVGEIRRPSIMTRVRTGFRPRNARRFAPAPAVDCAGPVDWGLNDPLNTGNWVMASGRLPGTAAESWLAVTTVNGVGASAPLVMARDPVTTTSATVSSAGVLAVCAVAE